MTTVRRSQTLGVISRRLIATLATVCALVQAFVIAHHVAVQHDRCAEHGELIHVGAHGHAVEPIDAHHATPTSVEQTRQAAAAHDHEHCGAQAQLTRIDTPTLSTRVIDAPPVRDRIGAGVVAHARSSSALFRLAPKTSPPRIG